jgi:hypothetical protein
MAESTKYTLDQLLPLVKAKLPELAATPKGRAKGYDIAVGWGDEKLKKAMGTSCKLPGAIQAIEIRVRMQAEARAAEEAKADPEASLATTTGLVTADPTTFVEVPFGPAAHAQPAE